MDAAAGAALTPRFAHAKPPARPLRMKPQPARSWRVALLALALAFWIHLFHQFAPFDTYVAPSAIDSETEEHFTNTYYEARALFRERAQAAQAKLHTLPLDHLAHLDLTIDVAVVPGASDKALIHISGTHGVEGFAGSAIQSALLERLANASDTTTDAPTLIFVHALNPFGMAMLRRFNEHNVDLNRNFMTPEGFKERTSQDPNAHGYVDLMDALNPPHPTEHFAWIKSWAQILKHALTHGFAGVKQAVVVGQSSFPNALYFCGTEQEPSVRLLFQFLREHLDFEALRSVGVIDVHTGLGPAGYDTLMLDVAEDATPLQHIFEGRRPIATGDSSDSATSGYEGTTGLLCLGFSWLLPAHARTVCLTQEFGTLAGPFVLNALVQEHAMFQRAPTRRLPYAEALRDAFYVHRSAQWKADVVTRGVAVWAELQALIFGDKA